MRRTISLVVALAAGCVHPPEIVMVDRATALEQQAGGSFDELERRLDRAGVEPHPVPFTPEQLETLGLRPSPLVDRSDMTDADRVEAFVVQHCVGEGKDGLLVDTHDVCRGAADQGEVQTLIDQTNRARRQLWKWMHDQRPAMSVDELRQEWRKLHVRNVACGGWVETPTGQWVGKSC